MGACYPDQVGGHKPCVLVVVIGIPLSPFGTVYCFATTVAVDAFGGHGASHDLAQRGVGWSGRESVMGNRSVLSEHHWSTRMGVRGHGFRGVGIVC